MKAEHLTIIPDWEHLEYVLIHNCTRKVIREYKLVPLVSKEPQLNRG